MYTDGCHLIENFSTIFMIAKNRIAGQISGTVVQNMEGNSGIQIHIGELSKIISYCVLLLQTV